MARFDWSTGVRLFPARSPPSFDDPPTFPLICHLSCSSMDHTLPRPPRVTPECHTFDWSMVARPIPTSSSARSLLACFCPLPVILLPSLSTYRVHRSHRLQSPHFQLVGVVRPIPTSSSARSLLAYFCPLPVILLPSISYRVHQRNAIRICLPLPRF